MVCRLTFYLLHPNQEYRTYFRLKSLRQNTSDVMVYHGLYYFILNKSSSIKNLVKDISYRLKETLNENVKALVSKSSESPTVIKSISEDSARLREFVLDTDKLSLNKLEVDTKYRKSETYDWMVLCLRSKSWERRAFGTKNWVTCNRRRV